MGGNESKLIQNGRCFFKSKEFEKAVECYNQSLAIDSKNKYAWKYKGDSLNKLRRHAEAMDCFERAISIDEDDCESWNGKGVAFHCLSRHQEAIECFDRSIALNETFKDAWNNKGRALRSLGRHQEAIDCNDREIEIDDGCKRAWNDKAFSLRHLGLFLDSIRCFDLAIRIDPNYKIAWNGKENALRDLQRYEEAIECFDQAIAIDEKFSYPWNNKGYALLCLGQEVDAIYCYDRALSIDYNYKYAWNGKGVAFCKLHQSEKAIFCYDEALKIDKNYCCAWIGKGDALCNLERYHDAFACYEQSLEIHTSSKEAWNGKGCALYHLHQFDLAIECFDRAIEIERNFKEAWHGKGCSLSGLKFYGKAIECFDRAISIDDKYEEAWISLRCALQHVEERESCHSGNISRLDERDIIAREDNGEIEADEFSPTFSFVKTTQFSEDSMQLQSSISKFLSFCSSRQQWSKKIVSHLSSLLEEECICNIGSLLQNWTNLIGFRKDIKLGLKTDMWNVLTGVFPVYDYEHLYPAFYGWNPNEISLSSSSSLDSNFTSGLHIDFEIYRGSENAVFKIHHAETGAKFAMKVYSNKKSRDHECYVLDSLPRNDYIIYKISSLNLSSEVLDALNIPSHQSAAIVFELGVSTLETVSRDFRIGGRRKKFKEWLYDAAFAIYSLHKHGWVHGDIKPSNFLFCSHFLKLIDLECSRKVDDKILKNECAPGTPMFASRKILHHNKEHRGELIIDPIIDIHSFGYLSYFILTGSPFAVDTALLMKEYLHPSADMCAVAEVLLHPDFNEHRVLENAIQHGLLDEQEASLIRKALSGESLMMDIIEHPYFGINLSETQLRHKILQVDHNQLLQSIKIETTEISKSNKQIKEQIQHMEGSIFYLETSTEELKNILMSGLQRIHDHFEEFAVEFIHEDILDKNLPFWMSKSEKCMYASIQSNPKLIDYCNTFCTFLNQMYIGCMAAESEQVEPKNLRLLSLSFASYLPLIGGLCNSVNNIQSFVRSIRQKNHQSYFVLLASDPVEMSVLIKRSALRIIKEKRVEIMSAEEDRSFLRKVSDLLMSAIFHEVVKSPARQMAIKDATRVVDEAASGNIKPGLDFKSLVNKFCEIVLQKQIIECDSEYDAIDNCQLSSSFTSEIPERHSSKCVIL